MSNETDNHGRTRRWPRRLMGTVLGLAVVVGTGAVANASAHGDGFLNQGYHPSASAPMTRPGDGNMDRDDRNWTWTGRGTDRWGFRSIVDTQDSGFNQALGINSGGTIVGYYGSGKDDKHPNMGWSTSQPYSSFRDVNFPGATQTQVIGINDTGTAVGFYVEHDGSNHGFVRWHGQYTTVDWPHTTSSPSFNQLLGISQNGIAAGFWNDAKGNAHGYLFDTRTHRFTVVRVPWAATSITVTGVNNDGTIVGFAVIRKVTVAFIITRRTAIIITLGNHRNTQILGINRFGVVVGSFVDNHGVTHGFIWNHGRARTVDAPWHATSTVINGISDRGLIVGFFEDGHGSTKGFLARQ